MKKIDEHYYIISPEEVTEEMELVKDGLYVINNDFYEVEVKSPIPSQLSTSRNIPSTNSGKTRTTNVKSDEQVDTRVILFILAVLFISFAVLCFYNGISLFRAYREVDDANSSLNNSYLGKTADELLRNGWIWFLGGIASFLAGIFVTVKYHKHIN